MRSMSMSSCVKSSRNMKCSPIRTFHAAGSSVRKSAHTDLPQSLQSRYTWNDKHGRGMDEKKRSEEKLKTFKRDINKRTFVNVEFDKKTLPTCC